MSGALASIKAVIVDIEGTTTPISFVHEVLFPFARERMAAFVADRKKDPEVARALKEARTLGGMPDANESQTVSLLIKWIDEDRKAGPLKFLQGMIWQTGYDAGVLKGPVYADAAAQMRNWHEAGLKLFVYSSGSVGAQKLIFGHSDQGDLTPLFSGYFDTAVGAKQESASYAAIAEQTGFAPSEMLFLSDHPGEVAAAISAGLKSVRIDREAAKDLWKDEGTNMLAGSFDPVAERLAQ